MIAKQNVRMPAAVRFPFVARLYCLEELIPAFLLPASQNLVCPCSSEYSSQMSPEIWFSL